MTTRAQFWIAHYAPRSNVGTTIAGAPSVAELRELVAAYDYKIRQLIETFVPLSPKWIASDLAGEKDFVADLEALEDRYTKARAEAHDAFESAKWKPLPETEIGASIEWEAVVRAFRQVPDVESKGDFMDLERRIEAQGVKPNYDGMPQPSVSNDDQLKLFKGADIVARKVDKLAAGASSALPYLMLAGAFAFGMWMRSRS